MASQTITSRLPQQGDPVEVLLARLLASTAQRVTGTALAAASRTITTQSSNIDVTGFSAIMVVLNVTSVPGAGGIFLRVRGVDPATGQLVLLSSSSATITSVSISAGMWGRGLGANSGATNPALGCCGIALPDIVRLEVAHSTGDPYTYSVSYVLIP